MSKKPPNLGWFFGGRPGRGKPPAMHKLDKAWCLEYSGVNEEVPGDYAVPRYV